MNERVATGVHAEAGADPLISVVITNFNYANFVGEAISSVLAQTYSHVECIVVDDGSKDNSREVIESFGGIKSKFQCNAGQAQAGRAGLSLASGRIVIFLDSDDYILPDACATIAASWSTGVAAALYRLKVLRDGSFSGEILPSQSFVMEAAGEFIKEYGYLPAAPMSGNAYAIDVVRRIFADGLHLDKNGLDAYLILCSPFLGKIVAIDQPLGVYRVHSSNISMFAKPTLRSVKSQNLLRILGPALRRDIPPRRRRRFRTLDLPSRPVQSQMVHPDKSYQAFRVRHSAVSVVEMRRGMLS